MRARGLSEPAGYLALLEESEAEWAALESEITIGETFFFRYAEQFAALRRTILPERIAARGDERRLRIWSAGCSTGPETYSVGIVLHELLGERLPEWRIGLTGTDINRDVLAVARRAVYGTWALRTLGAEERAEFLESLGLVEPGLHRLIREAYRLLGLQSYFTAGEKEVRAWTIPIGAKGPEAAGVIHSDFERGFIRAETVGWDDFVRLGSVKAARDQGLMRSEGKEYVVQDGDIMLFRFNV